VDNPIMRRVCFSVLLWTTVLLGCDASDTVNLFDVPTPPAILDCQHDEYAFAGRTSLAALGLADLWPEAATRDGNIWVAAGPPDPLKFVPEPAPTGRILCLLFEDGSGLTATVEDDWEPPEPAAATDGNDAAPWLILLMGVAVLAGVSVVGFRRRAPG
jgi:hypothetical protein